jgi:hypothetical protein
MGFQPNPPMSDHIQKTLDDALAELRKQEEAVISSKKFINQLCGFGKKPIMFPEAENAQASQHRGALRRNAFYGQPLATCVGEYLEWRQSAGMVKEASLDEIVAALKDGGFDLATISKDTDGQKRGVAITLGKNTAKFHRLPNGDFGLLSWYPNVKAKRKTPSEIAAEYTGSSDELPDEDDKTTTTSLSKTGGGSELL